MRRIAIVLMLATMMLTLSLPGLAQDVVELRMTWYTDGNEDVVMRDLLDRFEMENSDIRVVMDNVPIRRASSKPCRFNWQPAKARTWRA